jgi:hypothetical protein
MNVDGYSRLLFKEDFFKSQVEHVLLIMVVTSNEEHGKYFIVFTNSSMDHIIWD